jgi:hypothetical protein
MSSKTKTKVYNEPNDYGKEYCESCSNTTYDNKGNSTTTYIETCWQQTDNGTQPTTQTTTVTKDKK